MNILTIDIGNTGIKIDFWADSNHIARELTGVCSFDDFQNLIIKTNAEYIIFSSVRNETDEFVGYLKNLSNITNFDIDEIHRHYTLDKYKGNLGPDRMAAFLGAEVLMPGIAKLIIDLGTAMTIDVADENGSFCGGNISLGLNTRLKALEHFTGRLPLVENISGYKAFGHDTLSAIKAGAVNGLIGEILYAVKLAKVNYNIKNVVLTGGDAATVNSFLHLDIPTIVDPFLVGRGLNSHIRNKYANKAGGHV